MRKQVRVPLAFLLVTLISAIVWKEFCDGEPTYQGKRLSAWLKSFDSGAPDAETDLAADAVRHIGTNALPTLLAMIQSKDSRWELFVEQVDLRQPLIRIPLKKAAFTRRRRAVSAFRALGASAKPAVPALAHVLFNNPDNFDASLAMASIGPEALSAVMQATTNNDPKIRAVAVWTLGHMYFDPEAVVPVLIKSLKDDCGAVRCFAAGSLGDFPEQSALIVPALVECLADREETVRYLALFWLGALGREAGTASPAIRQVLDDPSYRVRLAAGKALKKIDPEAAAEADAR